jgi:hypothetical protein
MYNNTIGDVIFFPIDSLCHYYLPNGSILGKEIYTINESDYLFEQGLELLKRKVKLVKVGYMITMILCMQR